MAKDQQEEDAIERFRNFLGSAREKTFAITGRDVIVNPQTGENFDYQLQSEGGSKIAVELVRLVEDGSELAQQRMWGIVVQHLKEELSKRGVKGYLIFTPNFTVKKKDIPSYTVKLAGDLEQAIKNSGGVKKFTQGGFEFHKFDELDTISFSFHSGVRSIDPHGMAATGFAEKLPKKNRQVAIPDHERLILVTSWAMFVENHDAIKALSAFDFSEIDNVDKVYFERNMGEFALIFDRSVVEAIRAKRQVENPEALKLLIQYIRYQLEAKNKEAFEFVKSVTANAGTINWLDDNLAKENLIRFGEDVLGCDDIENAMWIVRQLKNDANPSVDGANAPDDPDGEHNPHLQIMRGEEVPVITTTRGHLSWLIARIVAKNKPEYYTELTTIVERYLREGNLYIRTQACIPLTELWIRRRATCNQDGSSFDWDADERQRVRALALRIIHENEAYPRVMKAILHVFSDLRDFSGTEAEDMLETFLATKADYILHDLAAFVMHFAFLRKDHFPQDGKFDPTPFIKILKDQILSGNSSMRSSLAWHFWKIVSDKILPYEDVKEYLPLFFEGPYDQRTISSFALLFVELSVIAPDDAVALYRKMIDILEEYLEKQPTDSFQSYIDGTEEIISLLTESPDELLSMIKRLKNIWQKGSRYRVYIGDIKTIFESYQSVAPERKEETRMGLREIYDEMKVRQPHLPPIDWEK